jgi:hypothetical protein
VLVGRHRDPLRGLEWPDRRWQAQLGQHSPARPMMTAGGAWPPALATLAARCAAGRARQIDD